MGVLRGTVEYAAETPPVEAYGLEVHLPVFEYVTAENGAEPDLRRGKSQVVLQGTSAVRRRRRTDTVRLSVPADSGRFHLPVPGGNILGDDLPAFGRWAARTPVVGWAFEVPYWISGARDVRLASGAFEVLFYADDHARAQMEGNMPSSEVLARSLFLLNAREYRRLQTELPLASGTEDQALLRVIADVGIFVGDHVEAMQLTDNDIGSIAESRNVPSSVVEGVRDRFRGLTSFDVVVPEVRPLQIAGTFDVGGVSEISTRDLGFYHLTADLTVREVGGGMAARTLRATWPSGSEPVRLPVPVDVTADTDLLIDNIARPVNIRVRGFDGTTRWQGSFDPSDEDLAHLTITVDEYVPGGIGSGRPPSDTHGARRIRGQVITADPSIAVSDLTVVVQAKGESDTIWRIVSAGQTDASGYFSVPYPRGAFVEAQALVSAAPDAVVDIGIVGGGPPRETLSDDFLYLVVDELDVSAGSHECTCSDGGSCSCGSTPQRLPDQADLVRSGDYSQDLGGQCVNVTTPNRTLREYAFTGVVRASDPDVANYTLRVDEDGSYTLTSTDEKIVRRPVDLGNPIEWQHAPGSPDELSFYQAVTVATGHILHYKAAFKADGYSLGDLIYSLPLAPGQKKQVVTYDMANTLEAGESQQLSQGERLAAELVDDRFITDELSGRISESLGGRSKAHTSGMSAGLGLGGSMGPIGGSLGIAGGFSNSNSSASQSGSRGIAQSFGESLRQLLTQNAEAYRELNASVVTTVKEGQEYSVTTEVVANHNHCHSLTMMYFEVLRHYVIEQHLTHAEECLFVPLLLTEFTPTKVTKWKDILASNLLPMPSNSYLSPTLLFWTPRRQHPLVRAFDALDRVETDWSRVDYPEGSYAEEEVDSISGSFGLRTRLPRPRTRFDRITSFPVTSETRTTTRENLGAKVAATVFLGPFASLIDTSVTETQVVLEKKRIFDLFMDIDANFQTARPADCMRVRTFAPQSTTVFGATTTLEFFQNELDEAQWQAYADILGNGQTAWQLLDEYFAGKLISEWDDIFNRDLAPILLTKIMDSVHVEPLHLDLTQMGEYHGGERLITVRVKGGDHGRRDAMPDEMRLHSDSRAVHRIREFAMLRVENVSLTYSTAHFEGTLVREYAGQDLLDADFDHGGVHLDTPLTSRDKRDPRQEDRYLAVELLAHLNAHIEHYNTVLWRTLDENRRFMLLDGFSIETYDAAGRTLGPRSLASVVRHELIGVAGNALVFPVAAGYHVSQALVVEGEQGEGDRADLLDHYRPDTDVEPYRLSVPTRGVYMEAVMGQCDACEDVQPDSSQDWEEFRTDEPTGIQTVVTPTPERTDWRAIWAQFASPLVQLQTPRSAPAPGAGLAGLSEALTDAGAFRDVTGLAANQDNAIRTYLSNQENARAFAEMAKGMAMQQHNSENSRSIMRSLDQAHDSGALSDEGYEQMVSDHLGQQIDGGARRAAEERARVDAEPSLTDSAREAVEDGREVTAHTTRPDGTTETVQVGPGQGGDAVSTIHYDVPLIPQPNKTSCWAASIAMLEAYRRNLESSSSVPLTAAEFADEVGYSLEQSYGWDRLESVVATYGFEDIEGLSGTQYPSVEQWHDWLADHGPLYVTIGGTPTHAIIVHGISGDGTPSGTRLDILNPWDITETFDDDPTVFTPPNEGVRLRWTVTELNQRLNDGELDTLAFYEDWRILYLPALAPGASVPTPGQVAGRTFTIRVINRFWDADPEIDCRVSLVTGETSAPVTGPGWNRFTLTVPDGNHTLRVMPTHHAEEPGNWATFAVPTPGTSAPSRVWLAEEATVTVTDGTVTVVSGNPNVTLEDGRITVTLRPLWIETPNKRARRAGEDVEYLVLHHTGTMGGIPRRFTRSGTSAAAAHYVIMREGEVVKMGEEAGHRIPHAGWSHWHDMGSLTAKGSLNDNSVEIEIIHKDEHEGAVVQYTEAQYVSLLALIGDICGRFPAIVPHHVIGHSDIATMRERKEKPTDPPLERPGQLGRKPVDPGRLFDWPRVEAAGYGIAPASEADTFATSPRGDMYDAFFHVDPPDTPPVLRGDAPDAVIGQVKDDLTEIGYYMPTATTHDYDDAMKWAVAVFQNRYFTGARSRPRGALYQWVDVDTAVMIKRVLHSVRNP